MMSFCLRSSKLVLFCASMLMLSAEASAVVGAVSAASAPLSTEPAQPAIALPAKPSEMLRAPLSTWEPVFKRATAILDERAERADTMGQPSLIELHLYRTVLSQAQQAWPAVLEGVSKTRQLQDSESGRQTAGLLNEVLARQAVEGGDAAWLQRALRDQVLAMPWAAVEPTIRTLRDQLAASKPEAIETFVVNRLDLAAKVSSNSGSVGFVMQLLGARFQLFEVMPRRDALVAGLDEAIAQRQVAK